MAMQHSNVASAFTPTEFGKLLNKAIQAKSVAFQATTVVQTDKVKVNFPLWESDPAVNWLAELATITATDGSTGEVEVTPKKVGGITRVSSEAADDSDPSVADLIGKGLANQIANSVDAAFLGNTVTNGPDGLLSIGYPGIDTGASIANLDAFVTARYAAQGVGADLTHWVMRPATAEAISNLKVQSGSNQHLVEFVQDGLVVAGLPVLVSSHVDSTTKAWGIPSGRVATVLRKGTEVVRSGDSGFYQDAVDIRAIARVAFGYLHLAAVVRLYDAA